MNDLKAAIVPGLLALVGITLVRMVAPTSTTGQLIGGAVGGIGGVFLAAKL